MSENVERLTAHHLPYRVVNIIETAQEFVVLVTACLESWAHLNHAIKSTVARGVLISLVMRAPDGAKRDRTPDRVDVSCFRCCEKIGSLPAPNAVARGHGLGLREAGGPAAARGARGAGLKLLPRTVAAHPRVWPQTACCPRPRSSPRMPE
jgi:hypothetical protein